ncbi:signal peptidase I [Pseudarthrobacter sp. NPDC092439]|uniref:signal peptidase I n=1 Tax=unclassified Pseudarthrobacter TaxID=2647000 RepID=UPI003821E6B7
MSTPTEVANRRPPTINRATAAPAGPKTGGLLATGILVLAIGAFLFLTVGPRVLGYQTATMLTGSMSPLINAGDVVVTVPTPVRNIGVGDIITYRIPVEDKRVVTHRVTRVSTTAGGTTTVRTKGDANTSVDPWTAVLQGATVHKYAFTIPWAGHVIHALREPLVLNTLMYGAPAVLVLGVLRSIWRRDPEDAYGGAGG